MMPRDEVELALSEIMAVSQKTARFARSFAYFILAALLLSANTYGIETFWTVALAIGLLGLMGTSAKIGQACLAVLAAMAVVPASALSTFAAVLS